MARTRMVCARGPKWHTQGGTARDSNPAQLTAREGLPIRPAREEKSLVTPARVIKQYKVAARYTGARTSMADVGTQTTDYWLV